MLDNKSYFKHQTLQLVIRIVLRKLNYSQKNRLENAMGTFESARKEILARTDFDAINNQVDLLDDAFDQYVRTVMAVITEYFLEDV